MSIVPGICITLAILWFISGLFRMLIMTTETGIRTYSDAALVLMFTVLFATLPPLFLVSLSLAFSFL